MTIASAAGTFAIGGDLTVNRMGFGAMRLTGTGIWGPPRDRDEAIRVLRRAVDLGVDLIDTAESYGPHVSEELIAEALHPYPDGWSSRPRAGSTARDRDVGTRTATAGQVALAWLLQRSPVMLPIPGTSRLAHLEENLAAVGLELSPQDVAALDAVTTPSAG